MKKEVLAFLLSAALLTVTVTGCAKSDDSSAAEVQGVERLTAYAEAGYTREMMNVDWTAFDRYTVYDGTVYMAYGESGRVASLYPAQETLYERADDEWQLASIDACGEGLWILQEQTAHGETGLVSRYRAIKISYDGEMLEMLDLGEYDAGMRITDLCCGSDGYLYLNCWNDDCAPYGSALWLAAPDGEMQTSEFCEIYQGLMKTADGAVTTWGWNSDNQVYLRCFSSDGGYEDIAVPDSADYGGKAIQNIGNGVNGAAATIFDDNGIYSLFGDGSVEPLIIWADNAMSAITPAAIFEAEDGVYFCPYYYFNGTGGSYGCYLLKEGEPAEKQTLVLAVFGDTNYRYAVNQFNTLSAEYYIQVLDYCEDGADFTDAASLLSAQLSAGVGPDIICFNGSMSSEVYGAKGFLLDLNAFLDADEEISRGDICLLPLMDSDGALYSVAANFCIETCWSVEKSLSGRSGWSYAEFAEFAANLPRGSYLSVCNEPLPLFQELLHSYIPTMIDWQAGECSFDSAEFIALLDASRSAAAVGLNAEELYADELLRMMSNGELALQSAVIASPYDIAEIENAIKQDITLIDWPTPDGGCGSRAYFLERFGIASECVSQEGAWELIKHLLSAGAESSALTSFTAPVLKTALDEITADLLGGDEPLVTVRQAEKFSALLNEVSIASDAELTAQEIITDSVLAYFAGDSTAEQAAELVRSRVGLYVSEQS
ncbi:MAG: hypothetical protein LUE06_07065 [Oscillospiraceae bacterium]|nr:hypothetical protein [Oscillospiraceae bacterium]